MKFTILLRCFSYYGVKQQTSLDIVHVYFRIKDYRHVIDVLCFRYYVFSGLNPPAHAFNSLLSAKATWESDPVTIIPTYDTDILHQWLATNRDELCKYILTAGAILGGGRGGHK